MSIIKNGSLIQIQLAHAAIKAAASMKRAATDEACYIARQKAVEREVVGRSIRMARGRPRKGVPPGPEFKAAAKRKKLYLSSTGLRAFHFGWSSVSKSSMARGAPGTRVYANAAALHIVYIEDGAIVRVGHTVYIDSSRVETRPDGERFVLSNISDIYAERVEFFQLVDQFERVNHGDKVEIDFEIDAAKWQAVVEDPICDPAVLTAYAEWADNIERPKTRPIALEGSGSNLRMLMKDHGFVFADPIVNEERLKRDGFCFHDGRGGRTEYRLVFELPREFNHHQRAEALARLCRHFDEAGCMYVAVIHAPDPHNDEDNYHVHLDFYDRKCRRLDGTDADLINVKKQFKPFVEAEMKSGLYRERVRDRAWDFTVRRDYPSNKCTKTHYPFGATHKSTEVRDIRFVAKVRKAFAADINAVAREAGSGDLYDPRSYAAMGMNCPASKKLGSAAHGLETKGVPTQVGLDNEAAQARFEMDLIASAHQNLGRQFDAIQYDWQMACNDAPVKLAPHKVAVEEELARAQLATDIRRDLALLELERERERSRAMLVSERQGRASRAGMTAAQLRSANLAQSADQHLADLDQKDVALVIDIAALNAFAIAHGPEQTVRAISEFKQAKLRQDIQHDLEILLPGQVLETGRRNIVMRRGTTVDGGNQAVELVKFPDAANAAIAKQNLDLENDNSQAASSPVTEAMGPSDPLAAPATPSDDRPATNPLDVDRLALAVSLLRAQQHRHKAAQPTTTPVTASGLEAPNGDGQIKPLAGDESLAPEGSAAEQSRASFVKENYNPSAPIDDGNEPTLAVEPGALTAAQTSNVVGGTADNATTSNTPDEQSAAEVRRAQAPSVDRSGDAVASQPPHRAYAPPTEEERREILRPRCVGPDGIFRAVDLPVEALKAKPTIVADRQALDPITIAKLLWAYDGINGGTLATLPECDRKLYSLAISDPLADELRAALAKGRENHREAFREAKHAKRVPHEQHMQAARQAQHNQGRV